MSRYDFMVTVLRSGENCGTRISKIECYKNVNKTISPIGKKAFFWIALTYLVIFRVVNDNVNNEHSTQSSQLDGISDFLLAFAENVAPIAQHQ